MANKWNSTTLVDEGYTKDDVNKALLDLLDKINQAYNNSFPVGYIYTQYPGTQNPASLFGGTWTDVTSTVPLGAQSGIHESGVIGNVSYIKYTDGTMVQWEVACTISYGPTNTAIGSLFYTGSPTATRAFPIPFVNIPSVTASPAGSTGGAMLFQLAGVSTGGFNGYGMTSITGSTGFPMYDWIAIGKWSVSPISVLTVWKKTASTGTGISNNPTLISPISVRAEYISASSTGTAFINYATPVIDTNNAVTTGVGTWKFTCPVGKSGLYLVETNTYNSAALNNVQLFKNGALFRYIGNTIGAGSGSMCNTTLYLNDNDFIQVRHDAGTGQPADPNVWIQITQMGKL